MRRHAVTCQIENEKRTEYIQQKVNESAVIYFKTMLDEGGFTKEEKLKIIDMLISELKG